MCARAEMSTVGDRHLLPDLHGAQIVDEGILTYRAPVPNRKIPREIDASGWVDVHLHAHLCAKSSQDKATPTEERPRTQSEKPLANDPENSAKQLKAAVFPRGSVCFDVQYRCSRVFQNC